MKYSVGIVKLLELLRIAFLVTIMELYKGFLVVALPYDGPRSLDHQRSRRFSQGLNGLDAIDVEITAIKRLRAK
jgi:hypothetical protein